MRDWQQVFRFGFAPALSTAGLIALRHALAADDPRLTQGATTVPPPLMCVQEWPVEGCCGLGWCGWQGEGLETVGEVEEFFARACYEADQRLGEPAACRWFLNWFDGTPRHEMRRELADEIGLVLIGRKCDNDQHDAEIDAALAAPWAADRPKPVRQAVGFSGGYGVGVPF